MLVFSDGLVVSGVSRQGCLLAGFAGLLGKPVVYIMHGSAAREAAWYPAPAAVKQEAYLMEKASLLLPVSKKFRDWVRETYPRYAEKTQYLYSGIERLAVSPCEKLPGSIAAAGGDGGIKANAVVARAVEAMEGRASLTVFGPVHREHPGCHVRYAGRLPQQEFLRELTRTELFVLNSRFESFSLSTIEALLQGCSVLVSENAGVAEVLALREEDMIHDPLDAGEVEKKIAHLLAYPNHDRLLASLDLEELSWESSAEKLERLCRELTKEGEK